jgi:hypothetical protein
LVTSAAMADGSPCGEELTQAEAVGGEDEEDWKIEVGWSSSACALGSWTGVSINSRRRGFMDGCAAPQIDRGGAWEIEREWERVGGSRGSGSRGSTRSARQGGDGGGGRTEGAYTLR